ncbi:amidohydrolase family protein [Micromonospora sp. WMMD712]|uniref:amidohydrolase family protein n=1 Tax=Micromonospora sp. WMMD712 TaxID=3016096 RepID=UPI00249CD9A3|nr:amidohydrolase family protein [Micromonospora sp. WMMD712]WFE55465.1 amidohydrolase family protein [Micromonospora sp. WMMD712]
MYDVVVRSGTVVDGTGDAARTGDVAISDGRIVAVGCIVTPGFVDIHKHFDGQVTWDPLLTPSCWHGVTTVVMGNCGVGFAPVTEPNREWLIGLMGGSLSNAGKPFGRTPAAGFSRAPPVAEAAGRAAG